MEKREFKWGYSPSKSYYIAYKLTLAIEYPSMKPLCFLLHQGSPNDANVKAVSVYKVVPLIFPKNNFSVDKVLGMMSYPLSLYLKKGRERKRLKAFFNNLVRRFKEEITNWKKYQPLRSLIEDVFKLTKSFFPNKKIHRYTKRSVQKHVSLGVLLVGIPISMGIREKEELQLLAEW